MSASSFGLPDSVRQYLLNVAVRESDALARLRHRTVEMPESNMQISAEQGALMQMLVKLIGAKRTLEVGTFTGYSALCVAEALPPDGKVVACDLSEEWTSVGRPYWEEAGVADRIELRIGPALDSLDALIFEGAEGSFDFAFIDADKENYRHYFERCLRLVRSGGLIGIDNVLWSGSVADPDDTRETTVAIREMNAALTDDDRIDLCMVPIGDGLTLARKR